MNFRNLNNWVTKQENRTYNDNTTKYDKLKFKIR